MSYVKHEQNLMNKTYHPSSLLLIIILNGHLNQSNISFDQPVCCDQKLRVTFVYFHLYVTLTTLQLAADKQPAFKECKSVYMDCHLYSLSVAFSGWYFSL